MEDPLYLENNKCTVRAGSVSDGQKRATAMTVADASGSDETQSRGILMKMTRSVKASCPLSVIWAPLAKAGNDLVPSLPGGTLHVNRSRQASLQTR